MFAIFDESVLYRGSDCGRCRSVQARRLGACVAELYDTGLGAVRSTHQPLPRRQTYLLQRQLLFHSTGSPHHHH